ncbi:hypothetical protein D3C76_1083390 [compost metagenome]
MIQWPKQGKGVGTIALHHESENSYCAGHRCQGIAREAVSDSYPIRGQGRHDIGGRIQTELSTVRAD